MKINHKLFNFRTVAIPAAILLSIGFYYYMNRYDFSANQKKEAYLIGESFMTMNNPFYKIISEEISSRVEAEGDRVILRDPALSLERQIEQIEEMLLMGVDAIVVTPVDLDGLTDVLLEAKKQGVRIIVADSDLKDDSFAECTITSDNYSAGYIVGEYFCRQHDEAKILVMTHDTAKSGLDRVRGFVDAVSQKPNLKIVKRIECEGQLEIAMPKLTEAIEQGVEFDQVFCLNDLASVGVAAALDEKHMLDQVGIYGVDATPDSKALIKEGMMEASAAQFPSRIGRQTAEVLYQVLEGQTVDKEKRVPVELVTKDNVDEYHINRWQ